MIGAVCLFVCHKSHYFRIQRIWSFHTFIATFRAQRIWSNLLFLDTCRIQKCPERVKRQNPLKYSKNLVNSPVSRHCLLGKVGRLEGLKVGRLEDWKVGMLEGWKIGRLEGSSDEEVLSFPKVIIPDRAERRR